MMFHIQDDKTRIQGISKNVTLNPKLTPLRWKPEKLIVNYCFCYHHELKHYPAWKTNQFPSPLSSLPDSERGTDVPALWGSVLRMCLRACCTTQYTALVMPSHLCEIRPSKPLGWQIHATSHAPTVCRGQEIIGEQTNNRCSLERSIAIYNRIAMKKNLATDK